VKDLSSKVLVLSIEYGKIVDSKILDKDLEEVVKNVLMEILPKWSPKTSDLIAMKHEHEVVFKLPLSKELYGLLSKYGLSRKSASEVSVRIPVYVVSYENRWVDDDLIDDKVYIIAPYINEEVKKEIELLATDLISKSEEAEEFSEEE
jgi:hypothetical protein